MISASEMFVFVKYLGLIVGDFIPVGNKVWELYIALRDIICIIMAPSVTIETSKLLATVIAEHHALYINIFKEQLKAKHHFLIHYPRFMEKIGPLKYVIY